MDVQDEDGIAAGVSPEEAAKITLLELEAVIRRRYLAASDQGVTYREMSEATGLPLSMFSQWLRGYRPIAKVTTLQAVMDGLEAVEARAMLR